METLTISESSAKQVKNWIETRQGIKVWNSINLSNPSGEWLTPVLDETGKETQKPNWQTGNEPAMIINTLAGVNVTIDKEIKRFHVAIRVSGNGLALKLTDASSAKVRRECDKIENSRYEFDYETQECIIFAPVNIVPLSEYEGN